MPSERSLPNSSCVESTLDLSRLQEFNPEGTIEVPIELVEQLEEIDVAQWLGDTKIVSFDQTIANCGYVVISPDGLDGVRIVEMGLVQTIGTAGLTQWEDSFIRSNLLFGVLVDLLREHHPALVLHETPPIGNGPGMHRTDSSIVAATVVQSASALLGIPAKMVSNNRVKAYLTGNRNAKKKEVRAALQKRFEVQLKTPGFRKNEHTFDALGVAVTYLEDVR